MEEFIVSKLALRDEELNSIKAQFDKMQKHFETKV